MGGGKLVTTHVLVQWGGGGVTSYVLVEKRQNSLELSSVALELSSMPLLSGTLSCLNIHEYSAVKIIKMGTPKIIMIIVLKRNSLRSSR